MPPKQKSVQFHDDNDCPFRDRPRTRGVTGNKHLYCRHLPNKPMYRRTKKGFGCCYEKPKQPVQSKPSRKRPAPSHNSSKPKKLKRGYATFDLSQTKQYRQYHGVSVPSSLLTKKGTINKTKSKQYDYWKKGVDSKSKEVEALELYNDIPQHECGYDNPMLEDDPTMVTYKGVIMLPCCRAALSRKVESSTKKRRKKR